MAINELILLYENNLETFDDSNFNVKWLKNNKGYTYIQTNKDGALKKYQN